MTEPGENAANWSKSPVESALRWLATQRDAKPFNLLVHALNEPASTSGSILQPLVEPTRSLPNASTETRALAAWGLIVHLVNRVGSSDDSRWRIALVAAFRLPRRAEITEPWKSTLGGRFDQLMVLRGIFGDPAPTTTTPMHQAWNRAVTTALVPALEGRLATLATDGTDWPKFVTIGRQTQDVLARQPAPGDLPDQTAGYRRPALGAQPVFLELFVTTVFMKKRTVYRRITERVVTAQADNVEGYLARALAGTTPETMADLPVRALWGCRAEPLPGPPRGGAILTRLRFPSPLRRGQKHYFSSEAVNESLTGERLWVNVEVDHHGIAPGQLLHGCVPISGLTIRIRFDGDHVPEAAWWYAEANERLREERPPDGDKRLLRIVENSVEHTFSQKCQPRENYGVSFWWPTL